MRTRYFPAILLSVTSLVTATLSVGTASATDAAGIALTHHASAVSKVAPSAGVDSVCDTSYGTPTGDAVISQDLNPYLNAQFAGAADFRCEGAAGGRTITGVTVWGYGDTDPLPFNITVYKDYNVAFGAGHQPRDRKPTQPLKALCATQGIGTITNTDPVSGANEWTIPLNDPCIAQRQKTDWIEVQAILDYAEGTWYWATQYETGNDFDADWRDANNTSGTDCITFSRVAPSPDTGGRNLMQDCIYGPGQGPGLHDFMFTLQFS